jgi:aryl-alcohol dehydrogenase-like predicted oxidoreductase
MLDTYVQSGGNFLDTADLYTGGKSEEICGRLIRDHNLRDHLVVATNYTFNAQPGNPNAGGNGRKNLYRALEGSLRRLQTDYIDLYWMHVWDGVTPLEEVMASMNDLVRSGKVRYFGFSDVPAWYAARAQTIAQFSHSEPVIALQLEYSLVERSIEREHVGAALELGMGICPWSALASGFLAGKYKRGETSEGRLEILKATGNRCSRSGPIATGRSSTCCSKWLKKSDARPPKWRSIGWRLSARLPRRSSERRR